MLKKIACVNKKMYAFCKFFLFNRFKDMLTLSVCPCALFIVISNTNFTGNLIRLNLKGKSEGIIGILGIKTVFICPLILCTRAMNFPIF